MRKKRISVSLPISLLLLACVIVYLFALTVYLQPGLFRDSLRGMLHPATLLVLNIFPIAAAAGLLYLLFGNVFAAAAICGLFPILSYANLLKQEGRNDPLIPSDITLLRESLDAVGSYSLDLHLPLLVLTLGSIVVFVVLAICVRTRAPRWRFRIAGAIALVAAFTVSMLTIYPDKDFYAGIGTVETSNVPQVFNTYGFVYCFLHNVNLYPVDKPADYSEAECEQWETETLEQDEPLETNVLFIMGEAFSDLSDEAVFGYTGEDNPTYEFHQIANSDRAVSGHIVVPNFGAGTANTEFDVLTGMQTNFITEGNTSAFRTVTRNIMSLFRAYRANGASTWFMHPGQSWFYNRENVYDRFGAEEMTFSDAFTNATSYGSFISDESFAELLEEEWSERTAAEEQTMAYSVTIENHQAYHAEKYGDTLTEELPNASQFSDEALEYLRVYFQGVRHTSEMLTEITDYLDEQDEPTLLVFFGDHLPALGADYLAYQEAGLSTGSTDTPEDVIQTYETPYFIWANEAFAEKYDFDAAVSALELPESGEINASYLGAAVYELTGMTGTDAYFDYLTQARRVLPVNSHDCYMLPSGEYTTELSDEQQAVLDKLHCWEYYRLRDQKIEDDE